jgi:hypothetical protein
MFDGAGNYVAAAIFTTVNLALSFVALLTIPNKLAHDGRLTKLRRQNLAGIE